MDPLKVDSDGTDVYNPPSQLIPAFIYIVGGNPDHILDGYQDTADK